MAWFYSQGHSNAIGWEVTTSADVIPYTGIEVSGELMDFQVNGEKYLLTENYSGGPITRNKKLETILVAVAWLGIGLALVAASFLKRIGFVTAIALFVLLINRLSLNEVGLFNSAHPLIVGGIPFVLLVGPLFYFHEYRARTSLIVRVITFIASSLFLIVFGVSNHTLFLDHFISHTTYTFAIAGILFLFAISEENVFAILFLVTRSKGGKSNHLHFIILSLIYLVNLILYYLNKSGYYPNAFSFFDPFVLFILSSIIALWSIKYKKQQAQKYFPGSTFPLILTGLGLVLTSFLSLEFLIRNDAVYESFHYIILYFHIGFGVFFLIYIIINFIDPLIGGFELYKIVYVEQNFPYISARLGGLVVGIAFYFLSGQEAFQLLKSGYYVHLGNKQETIANKSLALEYYQEAALYGYHTHYANYSLAWHSSDKGNEYLTKSYFENASSRYPSPYAFVNYAMLDEELNSSKAQVTLEQAAQRFSDGEILNNQGTLRMKRNEWDRALVFFKGAESGNAWNQAPLLNKWAVYHRLNQPDSTLDLADYTKGNIGVKANILLNERDQIDELLLTDFSDAPVLHRQAYLLNVLPNYTDTLLIDLATNELNASIDANFNDRLRKSMAIHYYKKGDVNDSFRMLDYLQANTYKNGAYLNDLGVLALDQGAYQLALDYFTLAKEAGFDPAAVNRIEALAALNRGSEIPDALIPIVKKDPGLTAMANNLLSRLENTHYKNPTYPKISNLDNLSSDSLLMLSGRNAFNEDLVRQSISILNKR
ncbi:MAG: hypothetical protein AAF551_10105, partial [Bacteroidota bacterium]